MKYITFTVPCYNSAAYMERCVDSLLIGGEDVEILLIDDGSTDRTGEIADEYERNYPGIVRAVHKSNGGHGSGVNAGLHLATGCYFKVVDSDDWLSEDAYRRLLARVKEFCTGAVAELMDQPDLIVCIILTITWRRERRTRWRTGMYSRRKRPVPGMTSDISDRPSI